MKSINTDPPSIESFTHFSTTTTMKEASILSGPRVEMVRSHRPAPDPDQVLTKVVVAGSNPKDWKRPERLNNPTNQGDDFSGIVHTVGSAITDLKPGTRVSKFHNPSTPHSTYAEYTMTSSHATLPFQIIHLLKKRRRYL